MRLEAIRVLVSGCERYRKESGCLPGWHKVIDWLKSIRPVKHEWSKEDEEIFNNIIEKAKGGHWIEVNKITWLINRFKSLRPSWKSSEEQIRSLEYFIELWGDSDGQLKYVKIFDDVKSLCEQLKKL